MLTIELMPKTTLQTCMMLKLLTIIYWKKRNSARTDATNVAKAEKGEVGQLKIPIARR